MPIESLSLMSFDIGEFNKRVLLTGAGFSRNWGGRLAKEMWEEIFSHPAIQKRGALRTLLIRTPLFEDAIAAITDPKAFDEHDREAMDVALREAFQRMDEEHVAQLTPNVDITGMRDFIGGFYSRQQRIGYIFFIESRCAHRTACRFLA